MDFEARRGGSWIPLAALGALGAFFLALGTAVGVYNLLQGKPPPDYVIPVISGFVMVALMGGLGVACSWGWFFPKRLKLSGGMIRLYQRKELVGQIPLSNLLSVRVVQPEVKPNHGGGALGAVLSELIWEMTIGMVLVVRDRRDPDTFWPGFSRGHEIRVKGAWKKMTYETIVRRLTDRLQKEDLRYRG